MKNILKIILKLCVSLTLLGYFLSRVDLSLVIEQIVHFPKDMLIFICLLYLVPQLINTFKWHLLLHHHAFLSLFKMTIIGQYYNLILPGQIAGEGVKAYKLGKGNQDAEQVAASVAVDKITAFIGLILVGIFGAALSRNHIHTGILVILSIILVLLALFLFFFHFQAIRALPQIILSRYFENSPRIGRLSGQLQSFMAAWSIYSRQGRLIFYSILLGVLFQLVVALITDLLARQLGIAISLMDWCWIMPIAALAVLLPLTIGGIGLREGSFITLLGWLGVGAGKALALSLMCFFIQILFAIWGLFLDISWHLRFMKKSGEKHQNEL